MRNPIHHDCDPDQLRLLLSDQLPEPLQSRLTQHVAECDTCRAQLETLAGDPAWWSEVRTSFHSDAASDSYDAPDRPRSDESFAVDFIVDFLEPCDQPGTLGRLGEYEVCEVIGRGGMGVVLKGFQRELGRYVAVKVMAPHLAASGAARQRFIREARAAAAIAHPNVMPIHAVCTSAQLPYLVMPFLACESLQQRLDREGSLEVTEVLRIALQASQALAASHAQGLVHRDVKPANILLEKGVDRVVLTDFGLARAADDASLTRTGTVAGTPEYMSPEQARGEPLDARSDLFSLGSSMYAMCTGRPPFRAETAYGILRRVTDHEPRPVRESNPAVPDWLDAIVLRLLRKNPSARFASAQEIAELLEQCLAHVQQPTVVPLPEPLRRANTWRRYQRRAVALAVIATALLVVPFAVPNKDRDAATGHASQHVSPPSAPAQWRDGIDAEIERLTDDIQRLRDATARDWDAIPITPEPLP